MVFTANKGETDVAKAAGSTPPTKADETSETALTVSDVSAESAEPAEPLVYFCSLPVANYQIGGFSFTNGYMTLSESEAEEFRALMKTQPIVERSRVRELDSLDNVSDRMPPAFVRDIDTSDNAPEAPAA